MVYRSDTIAITLKRLNVSYFLPAIQREFVWKQDQIIRLFDSIMRAYPISSFLLWDVEPGNRETLEVYRFLWHAKQGGTRNELASTHGVPQLILILDGQQRLTSLNIGLRGSFKVRKPQFARDHPDAWVTRYLHLDLLQDSRMPDPKRPGIRYGFHFLERERATKSVRGHCWLEVGQILNLDSRDRFYEFKRETMRPLRSATAEQVSVVDMNLDRLYHAIWQDTIISYYTEQEQDYDRVLDIFVRANDGGTKLTKSDLLLSMVTLSWDKVNAREEIHKLVDAINNGPAYKNAVDKDFVMKTCLVLSDLPVQYEISSFSEPNLRQIRARWPGIKKAIQLGMSLVNSFGIDRDTLTSANALIPIMYYLHNHADLRVGGTSEFDTRNAALIRHWLTVALLNGLFGGQSDSVLRAAREAIRRLPGGRQDFPAAAISSEIEQLSGKLSARAHFDDAAISRFLGITYGKPKTMLALSLLYDDAGMGSERYSQDHIFPKSLFTDERMKAAGLDANKRKQFISIFNRIGNLELLLVSENTEKSNQDFTQWLATRNPSFRQRHLIPVDNSLLQFARFDDFIKERERLIKQRLQRLFTMPSSMGKHT